MVVIFTHSLVSVTPLWSRLVASLLLLTSLGYLDVPFRAQCLPGMASGAVCGAPGRPDPVQGFGNASSDALSGIGAPSSGIGVKLDGAKEPPTAGSASSSALLESLMTTSQQRMQPAAPSVDSRPSVGGGSTVIWNNEGVLFRLDDLQSACAVNKQGMAIRPCH